MDKIEKKLEKIDEKIKVVTLTDEGIQKLENQEDQVFNGANAYIEKRKDGSYILHFGPTTQIISKEDVENGFYDLYPIINEK